MNDQKRNAFTIADVVLGKLPASQAIWPPTSNPVPVGVPHVECIPFIKTAYKESRPCRWEVGLLRRGETDPATVRHVQKQAPDVLYK